MRVKPWRSCLRADPALRTSKARVKETSSVLSTLASILTKWIRCLDINTVKSHAVPMSRTHTSETEEQSLPLASSNAEIRKSSHVVHRDSLARRTSVFQGTDPTRVQLNAIAQLGEDRRRASIAIRRQSLLHREQEAGQANEPLQHRGQRGSIAAYRRQSVATDRRQSVQTRRDSALDGKQSIVGDGRVSIAEGRGSIAERRTSVAPVQRSHRRSSVIDVVTQTTTQAVRRASIAMQVPYIILPENKRAMRHLLRDLKKTAPQVTGPKT